MPTKFGSGMGVRLGSSAGGLGGGGFAWARASGGRGPHQRRGRGSLIDGGGRAPRLEHRGRGGGTWLVCRGLSAGKRRQRRPWRK
ncbi:hypothetical protein TIFTF001_033040 [Ficus carica]|uniref:Uncharacterized protein n=1 Tax=Ficus carica TaxID=3494 RepID=A0AA88DY92_FICCA|nr:hypothetical protein TIFTF001_033040 [Ficus carica]